MHPDALFCERSREIGTYWFENHVFCMEPQPFQAEHVDNGYTPVKLTWNPKLDG